MTVLALLQPRTWYGEREEFAPKLRFWDVWRSISTQKGGEEKLSLFVHYLVEVVLNLLIVHPLDEYEN